MTLELGLNPLFTENFRIFYFNFDLEPNVRVPVCNSTLVCSRGGHLELVGTSALLVDSIPTSITRLGLSLERS